MIKKLKSNDGCFATFIAHYAVQSVLASLALVYPALLSATELEEILVTTQFKQESSQALPISSTIVSNEDIINFDIHGNDGLAAITPGLSHAEFAAGQSYLALRGILSIDDGPGMDNSVVVFMDGVYIGRLSNIDFDMLDIKRIEVLRGPQGTLFGRNAIGGAINIITNKATKDNHGDVFFGVGSHNSLRYGAIANAAITDSIAARLSISHREHDGYTRNILLNTDNQTEDKDNLRLQISKTGGSTDLTLALDYAEDKRGDMGRFPLTESGLGSLATWQALGGQVGKSTAPIDGFSNRRIQGLSLNSDTSLRFGTWQNIFAWRDSKSQWSMASTGAPIAVNPPFPARDIEQGEIGSDIRDLIDEKTEQISFESRWLANLNERVHLSLGLFLLEEETSRSEQYQLVKNNVDNGETLVGNEITDQQNLTQSQALYSQLELLLNDDWSALLGTRFTQDKKRVTSTSLNCGQNNELVENSAFCTVNSGAFLNIMSTVFQAEAEADWNDVSPKFVLKYQPNTELMAYASITKGYKSGGFSGSPGSVVVATTPVAPEEAWSYEIGAKTDFFSNRLRFNISSFYTEYEDLQIVRFGPSPDSPDFGSFTTTNIGSADISGIELEATWLVNDAFSLRANYGYLDTEIQGLILETTSGVVDASGSELRQAPQNKYHLIARYTPISSDHFGNIALSLDYQYADAQLSDYINRDTRIDELSQTNFSVHWLDSRNTWEAYAWVKNIEGTRRVAHSYTIAGGVFSVWSQPRTYGLTIKRKFN